MRFSAGPALCGAQTSAQKEKSRPADAVNLLIHDSPGQIKSRRLKQLSWAATGAAWVPVEAAPILFAGAESVLLRRILFNLNILPPSHVHNLAL